MKKTLAGFVLGVLIVPAFTYAAPDSIGSLASRLLALEKRVSALEGRSVVQIDKKTPVKTSAKTEKLERRKAELVKLNRNMKVTAQQRNAAAKEIQEIDKQLGTQTSVCSYLSNGMVQACGSF
ncbi:MAG: hypothetical protein QOE22_697 [Candidatus Parcubacteria bacterium]|jgi:hypothetical protein|nr:hypothetical protein [Candidatus Parcubacteria bacterium]